MVSFRSIFTVFTFFTAFATAAPTADALVARDADSGLVARDGPDVIQEIVQYFENLGGDIVNLTSGFATLAEKGITDVADDAEHIIGGLLGQGQSILGSNTTIQGLLGELNPANISSGEINQLIDAAINVAKDLLTFIPQAINWIIQAAQEAQGDVHKLLTLPHEVIQFFLTLFGQLSSLIPVFGTAIQVFLNLLKSADNALYNLL